MTLYEMTDNYKSVLEMAQNPDIDEQAIKDTLEAIQGDIKEKADGYAKVIKELDWEMDKLTAEIKRLTDRKNTIQNNIAYMKQSLKEAMTETGNTKFRTDLFSFNIQRNPPALVVDDEKAIPQEYLIPQEPKIDKKAIIDFLKSGNYVPYAHIEQSEGVRIR